MQRLLIIDDHLLFADGLKLILSDPDEGLDITVCNDALQALADQKSMTSYDLVLVDLNMPQCSGFSFLTAVRLQELSVDVAVVSGAEDKSEIERAIQLGAKGFIPKDSESTEMVRAVKLLLEGKRYLPDHWIGEIDWLASNENRKLAASNLTDRQKQVLKLMSEGLQNKQIAAILGVSVSSVKGHIELLFKNLNVNNRTACVQLANDLALI
jgi:DNA-binding NarL/FixJ family response regulator